VVRGNDFDQWGKKKGILGVGKKKLFGGCQAHKEVQSRRGEKKGQIRTRQDGIMNQQERIKVQGKGSRDDLKRTDKLGGGGGGGIAHGT